MRERPLRRAFLASWDAKETALGELKNKNGRALSADRSPPELQGWRNPDVPERGLTPGQIVGVDSKCARSVQVEIDHQRRGGMR